MSLIHIIRRRNVQIAAERRTIEALTFRRAYEMAHPGHAFHGSDEDINLIADTIGPLPDFQERVDAIVAEMEWVTIH